MIPTLTNSRSIILLSNFLTIFSIHFSPLPLLFPFHFLINSIYLLPPLFLSVLLSLFFLFTFSIYYSTLYLYFISPISPFLFYYNSSFHFLLTFRSTVPLYVLSLVHLHLSIILSNFILEFLSPLSLSAIRDDSFYYNPSELDLSVD